MNRSSLRPLVMLVTFVILPIVFIALLLLAFYNQLQTHLNDIVILTGTFIFSLAFAVGMILGVLKTFVQHFYGVSEQDASILTSQLIFGGGRNGLIEVQAGRIRTESSSGRVSFGDQTRYIRAGARIVLQQVGGPGYVRIDHDSAVVTERLSRLHRVLGPGFHPLQPFEKIWDAVDLRPQRRSEHIKFMTRDGIPVHCDATIRFRVGGNHTNINHNYTYTDRAIRNIVMLRRVGPDTEEKPLQDWTTYVSKGLLIGETRAILEQYSLDEFLNPRYWVPQAAAPSPEPRAITDLENDVFAAVQERGAALGITIESVQLGPILPSEDTISRQWLEFWQARLQRLVDESLVESAAVYQNLVIQAQINAKTELLTTMLDEVQDLTQRGVDVPAESVVLSFFDALRSIAEKDPTAQQALFQQMDALINIVQGLT